MVDKFKDLWNNPWFWFGLTVANFMHTAYQMMANPSWFIAIVGTLATVTSYIVTLRVHADSQKSVADPV